MKNDKLWQQYFDNPTVENRNRLVKRYMGVVYKNVGGMSKYLPDHLNKSDLKTSAKIGLIKAVEGFDPSKDTSFLTYARLRVRGTIIDYLRKYSHFPRSQLTAKKRYKQSFQVFAKKPNQEELAEFFGVDTSELLDLERRIHQRQVSLQSPVKNYLKILPQRSEPRPSKKVETDDFFEYIKQFVEDRSAQILKLWFSTELTMAEIGEIYNISHGRVYQVYDKALDKLKEVLVDG